MPSALHHGLKSDCDVRFVYLEDHRGLPMNALMGRLRALDSLILWSELINGTAALRMLPSADASSDEYSVGFSRDHRYDIVGLKLAGSVGGPSPLVVEVTLGSVAVVQTIVTAAKAVRRIRRDAEKALAAGTTGSATALAYTVVYDKLHRATINGHVQTDSQQEAFLSRIIGWADVSLDQLDQVDTGPAAKH